MASVRRAAPGPGALDRRAAARQDGRGSRDRVGPGGRGALAAAVVPRPWAALLTVHATVYRTLARGLQQAAAAVVGVLLAFAVGAAGLGVGWPSLAVVVLLGLLAGMAPPLRAESTTAAATALVVLLTGYSDDGTLLLARLADTFVGIAVGLVVNLAVWPPCATAARRGGDDRIDDRLGALLGDMARAAAGAAVERDRVSTATGSGGLASIRSVFRSGRPNSRHATSIRSPSASSRPPRS